MCDPQCPNGSGLSHVGVQLTFWTWFRADRGRGDATSSAWMATAGLSPQASSHVMIVVVIVVMVVVMGVMVVVVMVMVVLLSER
jgi:hypothetical protein